MSSSRRIRQRSRKIEGQPSPEFLHAIGVNIHHYRRLRNLTQRELDELAGLSDGYTSELERGKQNPTVATLEVIAAALAVTEVDLVKRDPPVK
jgi:transcriptional regulator with XRE-family HTH domain